MESLLNRPNPQAELVLGDPELETPQAEGEREYTAALFFERHPTKYQEVVHHLAEGVGLLRISRMLQCSVHTVIAVRDREPVAIQKERSRLSDLARVGARLSVEGIVEDLADPIRRYRTPMRDKAVVAGILIEKSELLAGGATQRVEHIFGDPTAEDFNKVIDAECSEATHFGAGTPEQRAAIDAAAGGSAGTGASLEPGAQAATRAALPPHVDPIAIVMDVLSSEPEKGISPTATETREKANEKAP